MGRFIGTLIDYSNRMNMSLPDFIEFITDIIGSVILIILIILYFKLRKTNYNFISRLILAYLSLFGIMIIAVVLVTLIHIGTMYLSGYHWQHIKEHMFHPSSVNSVNADNQ